MGPKYKNQDVELKKNVKIIYTDKKWKKFKWSKDTIRYKWERIMIIKRGGVKKLKSYLGYYNISYNLTYKSNLYGDFVSKKL